VVIFLQDHDLAAEVAYITARQNTAGTAGNSNTAAAGPSSAGEGWVLMHHSPLSLHLLLNGISGMRQAEKKRNQTAAAGCFEQTVAASTIQQQTPCKQSG
jgi:hypothetical protein